MMDKPCRVQLRRAKGWRMPENTVSVARPGKFGNPFTLAECRDAGFIGTDEQLLRRCVEAFRVWIDTPYWRNNWDGLESERARSAILEALPGLRGKNLGCWCRLCEKHQDGKPLGEDCPDCAPCHSDPLGEVANRPIVGVA